MRIYDYIVDHYDREILKGFRVKAPVAVVTGQPGIGEFYATVI